MILIVKLRNMPQDISPIMKPDELIALHQTSELILIDASNGNGAKENYGTEHLDGALYVDLNTQLANINADVSIGGRHPLPTLEQFSETLTSLGITPTSHVMVYDDKNGSNAAARFWWMLKSVGHQKVQVLDGGFQAAIKVGFPTSSKTEFPLKKEPYEIQNWLLPLADIHEINKVAQDTDFLVVDVRDEERYNGEKEPIDLIAGHIPGAINIPFTTNLDSNGFFLSPEELKNNYLKEFKDRGAENVIVHCGSGVTACHTLLALAYAGLEIPKLYVGSWSEWSRNNRPIATSQKE
ncbi:sulfurtransferase [Flavobacterium sp. GSP11]|uniref:sulfurtransferase n=2 Tax=unclassified Flavobacterium TaxID=196869 RepID=UPI003AACDB3C